MNRPYEGDVEVEQDLIKRKLKGAVPVAKPL